MATPNVRLHQTGLYEARVSIRGKRHSAYGKSAEAALEALDAKLQVLLRKVTRPEELTFRDYYTLYYKPLLAKKSDGLQRQSEWAFKHWAPIHDRKLTEITRHELQIILYEQKFGSENTYKHMRARLHEVLELAASDEIIPSNPCAKVKIPTLGPKLPRTALDAERLGQMVYVARETKNPALNVLLFTGCMGVGWEELRAVTPSRLAKDRILVPGTKNVYRERSLPIPEVMRPYIVYTLPLVQSSDSNVNRSLIRLCEAWAIHTGATEVPAAFGRHVLRRTCATGLQELGCPAEVRNRILGHSDRSMAALYALGGLEAEIDRYLTLWAEQVLLPVG